MIPIFSKTSIRYIKKFLLITGSIAGIYLVIAAVATISLIAADKKIFTSALPTARPNESPSVIEVPTEDTGEPVAEQTPSPTPENDDGVLKPPARTTFLLIALDQERVLTDALMAGCFYRDTCEIRLMSIPRDLYTKIPEERLKRMREDNLKPPASGAMKINALRSYGGGRSFGNKYLIEQLNEMLGVQLQYYVEVDIPAFKKIVDILGGVEMEIPNVHGTGGLYYDDPEQNLHIAIPAGKQFLNGDMAEGVVRYRRYETGDVGRNAMQMEFMKQLFKQALRRETITNDPMGVIDIILNDVRTNIGADLIKYVPYVSQFSSENLTTYTMPGEGAYSGDTSYFFPDNKKLADAINEVFYTIPQP